jgi:hypothetical protein
MGAPFLSIAGQFLCGVEGHFIGNLLCLQVKGTAEDGRKAQRIVDLIGKVASAGAHDPGPCLL